MPSNLPLPRTSFVGRETQIEQVKQLRHSTRLLTLTGAGGCGKTRLALRAAADMEADYVDGVWLVELAAVRAGTPVVRAVAATLRVREAPDRDLGAVIVDHVTGRRMLLVLDNCEHVIAHAAELTDRLLDACPHLEILATSREPLGCAGETTLRVPSLTPAEAEQLFMERASAARADVRLAPESSDAVAELCQRLDGIPLAIELAAARVRAYSIEQMLARLDDRFRLLSGGPRTAMPRQQTLLAAVDWSYGLLSEDERALLRRLSVFAGGWSLEAAEAVAGEHGVQAHAVLELLAQLVDKSLIVADEQQGRVRYRLLESIRQFARERLGEGDEAGTTRDRHLHYFLELAEGSEPGLRGSSAGDVLDRIEAEHDNLRAALDWSLATDSVAAVRLSGALVWFWWGRSYHTEGRRWLARALAINPGRTAERMKALHGAGWLAHHQRDLDEARRQLEESLDIARERNDLWTIAWTLHGLGRVAYFEQDPLRARTLAAESLAVAEADGDPWLVAFALHLLGIAAYIDGQYPSARALYERSLAIRREIGWREGIGVLFTLLGIVAIRERDFDVAASRFREGLDNMRGVLNDWGISVNLACFAGLAGAEGRWRDAARLAGASSALRQSWQTPLIPLIETIVDEGLAHARQSLGDEAWAAAWAEGQAMSLEESITFALEARRAQPRTIDSLSPTEARVLRLLAQGDTTREIAEQLVVAVSTADRHITHIYSKLGVRNRAEATAYAHKHGLA